MMKSMSWGLLVAATIVSGTGFAQERSSLDADPVSRFLTTLPGYYKVATVETKVIDETADAEAVPMSTRDRAFADIPGLDLDTVVRVGKAVWQVIKDNQPVLNVANVRSSALPKGVTSWVQLQGWQAPKSLL